MPVSNLSLALSELAERETPEVLARCLEMFHGCGQRLEGGAYCGASRAGHPQAECERWVAGYGIMDGLRLLERLTALSRHEAKVDAELGLDTVRVEVGDGLMALLAARGHSVESLKRMTVERRAAVMLECERVEPRVLSVAPRLTDRLVQEADEALKAAYDGKEA